MAGMLFLCAVILSIFWVSVIQASELGLDWDLFPGGQVSAEAREEKQLAVDGPVTLQVKNSIGPVTIIKGAEATIDVAAHKITWGATQAEAEARLTRLPVEISQEKNVITVQAGAKEASLLEEGRSDVVEFTITVPAETGVTAYTGSGNIELSGVTGQADLLLGLIPTFFGLGLILS